MILRIKIIVKYALISVQIAYPKALTARHVRFRTGTS